MVATTTIAIEGCCHGDLDRIYEVLAHVESHDRVRADFMICCGDFQAIRTTYGTPYSVQAHIFRREELETLACPPVYRHMKDFHTYWREEKIPRCLTMFVGGNHEAPGHLREMYFGGFAARDIFYLGATGVFNVNGLRIAGLSGIYKSHDYDKPIFESPPYTENTKRSAYHVRRYELEKLMVLEQPVDILVSHDWPTGITSFGDTEAMLRLKDRTGQLRGEIQSGQLGNPHAMNLLKRLKPKFWFCGHMHIKYSAIYTHEDGSITRFLALDKCIPRRPFLQLLTVTKEGCLLQPHPAVETPPTPAKMCMDLEWLAILKLNNAAMPVNSGNTRTPLVSATAEDIEEVRMHLRQSTVSPKPVELSDGFFEFPYLGQVQPGDDRYRQWICDAIGMRDRISENSQFAIPTLAPPPVGVEDDALFFEDE